MTNLLKLIRLWAGLALRRGPPLQGVDDPGNGTLAEVLSAARARIDEVWLWGGPYFGYWEYNVRGPMTCTTQ